jgi:hypothetical protein
MANKERFGSIIGSYDKYLADEPKKQIESLEEAFSFCHQICNKEFRPLFQYLKKNISGIKSAKNSFLAYDNSEEKQVFNIELVWGDYMSYTYDQIEVLYDYYNRCIQRQELYNEYGKDSLNMIPKNDLKISEEYTDSQKITYIDPPILETQDKNNSEVNHIFSVALGYSKYYPYNPEVNFGKLATVYHDVPTRSGKLLNERFEKSFMSYEEYLKDKDVVFESIAKTIHNPKDIILPYGPSYSYRLVSNEVVQETLDIIDRNDPEEVYKMSKGEYGLRFVDKFEIKREAYYRDDSYFNYIEKYPVGGCEG